MKKVVVMNCLIPIAVLLLTLFFAADPAGEGTARQEAASTAGTAQAPKVSVDAGAGEDAEGAVAGAGDIADGRVASARAATQQASAPAPVRIFSLEFGETAVSGSEAEADAMESTGVLNRLELFEF